jgi:hypothetical protein
MVRHFPTIGCAALLLAGCNPDPRETEINTRLKSPDGKLEAVYAEDISGGPATGVSEDVYIVEPNRFPRIVDRVLTQECIHDLRLTWESARTLRISYWAYANMQIEPERDQPDVRWIPWLWGKSPEGQVQVRIDQQVVPGNRC